MKPVYLYELLQNGVLYRGTSYDKDVTAAGHAYGSINITHSDITKTSDLSDSGTTLTIGTKDPADPILAFLAGAPVSPINVGIFETYGPGFTQVFSLYKADVKSVEFSDEGLIKVSLTSIMRVGDQSAPRAMIQMACNWKFGEPNTCRADVGGMTRHGPITVISGNTVTIPAAAIEATIRGYPDWFALGRISAEKETRLIMKQAGAVLTLNAPFLLTTVGQQVFLKPGCDRRFTTCTNKFGNSINFGGMPFLPLYNPLISQGYIPQQNGKKGNSSSK